MFLKLVRDSYTHNPALKRTVYSGLFTRVDNPHLFNNLSELLEVDSLLDMMRSRMLEPIRFEHDKIEYYAKCEH